MEEIDNFMAMVPSEDAPIMPTPSEEPEETETPSESPAENEPTEEAPSPDGAPVDNSQEETNVPFHKHPRWVEREKSWKERFSSQESQIAQLRSELESKLSTIQNTTTPGELPDDFVKLYGSDPEAFKLWRKSQEELASRIKAEIRQEEEQRQVQERQRLTEGERFVEDSLQSLEDDGKVFDRNELMKFMVDFKEKYGALPSDENDNLDFRRGYELMMDMKAATGEVAKAKSTARKNLASFSSSSTGGEAQSKDYLTSQDLKNMDWDSLVG